MQFEIDVLILFADHDDETKNKAGIGWVAQFKKFLELMLTQVLGEKPNVLMKSEFDSITAPHLNKVATSVMILSPNFIQSGRCLDHVDSFYKEVENTEKKYRRIFKVFKNPLNTLEQPPRLRELIGYDMFQLDPDSGEIKEYTDYFSSDAERQYWMKMVDLAYDICDTLLLIRNGLETQLKNIYSRKTIYVAETGHDLTVQRNIIKRELQRHGYTVLPNQTLHGNAAELEKIISKNLDDSDFSIHLIGSSYGEIPEGSDRSIIEIQNAMAADKSQQTIESQKNFPRLIWISPNLANASEKQRAYIERIKRDAETQEGAEILQTPLEDFKNIMREELLEVAEKKSTQDINVRTVYLVHDKIDQKEISPIANLIKESGFHLLTPGFEGELLELRRQHIENLRSFDAAIIYKGKVNEQWVRMKILDLMKAPGFGRKKPIIGKAIMTAPGTHLNPDTFKNKDLRVIEGDDQNSMEKLKTYLQEFQ